MHSTWRDAHYFSCASLSSQSSPFLFRSALHHSRTHISMPHFTTPLVAASARVLYLAHTPDESNDSVAVEFPKAALTHLRHDALADISKLTPSSFDVVLTRPTLTFSPPFLASILSVLAPGGSLVALVSSSDPEVPKLFQSQLVLSGFVDVAATPVGSGGACATEIVAQRPPWSVNASAPLKLKRKTAAPAATAPVTTLVAPSSSTSNVWNLAASDINELDADLADEDALLAKDTFVPAPRAAVSTDCGTGAGVQKKACKNCTCGLSEEQAAPAPAPAPVVVVKPAPAPAKLVSACGSCGLGDAFRCGGCPYLGKPAFDMSAANGAVKLKL